MKCGVRFCGGCNPRYDRGKAYKEIREDVKNISFFNASEEDVYDILLVIGGCPSCCASYEHFNVKGDIYKIWDRTHIDKLKEDLKAK